MKNRHESNTYFVVQQCGRQLVRFFWVALVHACFNFNKPGKINHFLFLESSCKENFGQMIIFPQLFINFVMTKTECRSRFPKSHVGSFKFSLHHISLSFPPFHPATCFVQLEDVAPTGGKWKKKGLWLILLIEMKWMFRIWRSFLSISFSQHISRIMGSLFLNPSILFDSDSHSLRMRVGPEGTKIFGKNGPAQLVAAWGKHRCGLSALCKQEKNGEDGSFSNLALKMDNSYSYGASR